MVENLNALAREILERNQYCSIATSNISVGAWISPVVYVYDKDWNLYFVSMTKSKHCKNIAKNSQVAISIFDSQQNWGEGVGLQIDAEASPIRVSEIPRIAKLYATRKYPYGGINTKAALNFINSAVIHGNTYKIYRITPKTVWMNYPNAPTDVRVKIDLSTP